MASSSSPYIVRFHFSLFLVATGSFTFQYLKFYWHLSSVFSSSMFVFFGIYFCVYFIVLVVEFLESGNKFMCSSTFNWLDMRGEWGFSSGLPFQVSGLSTLVRNARRAEYLGWMEVDTRDGEVITFGCSHFEVPMGCTSGDFQYKYSALPLTCIKRSENIKWKIPEINSLWVLNCMLFWVAWWSLILSHSVPPGHELSFFFF